MGEERNGRSISVSSSPVGVELDSKIKIFSESTQKEGGGSATQLKAVCPSPLKGGGQRDQKPGRKRKASNGEGEWGGGWYAYV